MMITIGTCSLCGGPVQIPEYWMGVNPPIPTCASCGATASRPHGPVIPMDPPVHPIDRKSRGAELEKVLRDFLERRSRVRPSPWEYIQHGTPRYAAAPGWEVQ